MMKKLFSEEDIRNLESPYRAQFINSLGGFKSIVLVGTISSKRIANLAIFSSFFHIGANPPLFGLIIRPNTIERNTLNNILENKQFTLNHIQKDFYKAAHQTSAKYGADINEFNVTGLTEEYRPNNIAPYVKESTIQIGAEFVQKIELEINGTIMILSKITSVSLPPSIINKDGFINLEQAGTLTCTGLDSYHETSQIGRLAYARPEKSTTELIL